jgi:hypothetical protein
MEAAQGEGQVARQGCSVREAGPLGDYMLQPFNGPLSHPRTQPGNDVTHQQLSHLQAQAKEWTGVYQL